MRSKEAKLRRDKLDQENRETEGLWEGTEELHPRPILSSLLSDNQTQVLKIKSKLAIERLLSFPRDISNREVSKPRTGLLKFVIFEFNRIITTSLSSLSPNKNPIEPCCNFSHKKEVLEEDLVVAQLTFFPSD